MNIGFYFMCHFSQYAVESALDFSKIFHTFGILKPISLNQKETFLANVELF